MGLVAVKLHLAHRARRFFGSLLPSAPSAQEMSWAANWLTEREQMLLSRMNTGDRAHSLAVARALAAHFERRGEEPTPWMMTAALMHDVGKTVVDLGTYGRVVATLSGWVGGADMAEVWSDTTGFTRKVGLYLRYPELGADLLAVAGSDERVVAWSREHHMDPDDWTVPRDQGELLVAADDGRL